jgi:hypothetical protein
MADSKTSQGRSGPTTRQATAQRYQSQPQVKSGITKFKQSAVQPVVPKSNSMTLPSSAPALVSKSATQLSAFDLSKAKDAIAPLPGKGVVDPNPQAAAQLLVRPTVRGGLDQVLHCPLQRPEP